MKNLKLFWVYILECENGSFYTGYTNNFIKRYQLHLEGKACKYTRSFKPVKIAQCWPAADKSTAMKLESYIKRLSKEKKAQVIKNPDLIKGACRKSANPPVGWVERSETQQFAGK